MDKIIEKVRQELMANANEKMKESSQRFFKEDVKVYGMKSSTASKIGKKYLKELKGKTKKEVFEICEKLWQSGYLEETSMASDWAYSMRADFKPEDFKVFESWVKKYVSNWAQCDVLCNHTIGHFIVMYPEFIKELKKWAVSDNRWVKRAAAVTFICPAKKGLFHKEIFEIADILLLDSDDLVQKGYGWALKSAADFDQKAVFDYVVKNKAVMPRTALRYAIEKMPKELKAIAMAK